MTKQLLFLASFVFTSQGAMANCIQENLVQMSPVVQELHDFNGDCRSAIETVLKNLGCSGDEIADFNQSYLSQEPTTLTQGGATYCTVSVKDGVFQVMTSHMAEPPIAAVLFSNWD